MHPLDKIEIGHSRQEETFRLDRLNVLKGYLGATLSPLDLLAINRLHDHKGTLTVVFDKTNLDRLINLTDDDYLDYLKKKISSGWEYQYEHLVEFEYEQSDSH